MLNPIIPRDSSPKMKLNPTISHDSNFDVIYAPRCKLQNKNETIKNNEQKTSSVSNENYNTTYQLDYNFVVISCDDSGCHC